MATIKGSDVKLSIDIDGFTRALAPLAEASKEMAEGFALMGMNICRAFELPPGLIRVGDQAIRLATESPKVTTTLYGYPLVIDETMPEGQIQFVPGPESSTIRMSSPVMERLIENVNGERRDLIDTIRRAVTEHPSVGVQLNFNRPRPEPEKPTKTARVFRLEDD